MGHDKEMRHCKLWPKLFKLNFGFGPQTCFQFDSPNLCYCWNVASRFKVDIFRRRVSIEQRQRIMQIQSR